MGAPHMSSPAVLSNIRLGREEGTNTLAYFVRMISDKENKFFNIKTWRRMLHNILSGVSQGIFKTRLNFAYPNETFFGQALGLTHKHYTGLEKELATDKHSSVLRNLVKSFMRLGLGGESTHLRWSKYGDEKQFNDKTFKTFLTVPSAPTLVSQRVLHLHTSYCCG